MSGDDGLTVGLPQDLARLGPAMERVALEMGMTLDVVPTVFIGHGPRAQFCSRVFLVYRHHGELKVKSIRLISRSLVRVGHTVRTDMGSGKGLLKAKAISEMTWARGVPCLQSLFVGILSRRDIIDAKLSLDDSTIYSLLSGIDPAKWVPGFTGTVRSNKKREAIQVAKGVQVTFLEPDPGLRAAFADYTGIAPEQQRELESYLEGMGRRPMAYIPDDSVMGLIRDEWL